MSKIMAWCTGVVVLGVLAGCGQSAAPLRAVGGSRGRVIEVPGLGALSTGKHGYARVNSVACGLAGNCVAGGDYRGLRGGTQTGFVAVERNGVWGTATGVPGLPGLNKGRDAGVVSSSCGSAGSCTVGGYYADADLQEDPGPGGVVHPGGPLRVQRVLYRPLRSP
jgi:hypothetical protein